MQVLTLWFFKLIHFQAVNRNHSNKQKMTLVSRIISQYLFLESISINIKIYLSI